MIGPDGLRGSIFFSKLAAAIVVVRVPAFYADVPQGNVMWAKCLLTHCGLYYRSSIPTVGKMNLL